VTEPVFHADPNVVDELANLTRCGVERLRTHLAYCATNPGGAITIQFTSIDMRRGSGIVRLRLTLPAKGGDMLDSSVTYENGVEWSKSSLRIWGTVIPDTAKTSAIARRLGDVVAGAPFPDMIVQKVTDTPGFAGTSIRCKTVKKVPINLSTIIGHPDDETEVLRLATELRLISVDAFTAQVLLRMERMRALSLLVHMAQREPAQMERLPIAYEDMLEKPLSSRMAAMTSPQGGSIHLQKLITGFRASAWISDEHKNLIVRVSEGYVFMDRDDEAWDMSLSEMLGIKVEGALGTTTRQAYGGVVGVIMAGNRSVGDLFGL